MAVEPGFEKFFKFYYKARWVSLVFWIAAIAVGGYYGVQFLGMTNSKYRPPPNSQGMKDNAIFAQFFQSRANEGQIVVMLGATDAENGPDVRTGGWANESSQVVINAVKNYPGGKDFVTQLVGRYTWNEEEIQDDPIAMQFVDKAFFGPQNRSTIMLMSIAETGNGPAAKFVKYFRKTLDEQIDTRNGTFTVYAIGIDTMVMDMSGAAVVDLKSMDTIALPIALLVLIIVVRSSSIMIVPVIAVGASVAVSFGLMSAVASRWDVPTFCPAVMMSVIVAMSIDYSLFVLTRFHEETVHGHTHYNAVMNTLRHSGQTIATSGFILTICLVSLVFFPVTMMAMVGVSSVLALLSTLITALWLTPTLLLIGGKLFSIQGIIPCIKSCRTVKRKTKLEMHNEEVKGWWFRFTHFTTQLPHSILVILVIVAVLAPFCCGLLKFYTVTGLAQAFPRGSQTLKAYDRFSQEWPIGMLESFTIVAVPTCLLNKTTTNGINVTGLRDDPASSSNAEPVTIFTDEYFEVSHRLTQALLETGGIDNTSMLSITNMGGQVIDRDMAEFLLATEEIAYTYSFNWLTNSDRTATRITISTNFDPNLDSANVTRMIRPILKNFTDTTNFTFVLVGGLVPQADSAVAALEYLPYILGATVIIIGLAVAIVFRAVLLPLRMVFTIALTVAWTYGVMAEIFCTGWFNFIPAIAKQPGLNWIVPNLSIFMCIGLALDYDIFLFTRVREFRLKGWSNRAAIVKGVARTGRVITFAGIIMAIAFSGLAASSLLLLDQFAYVLMFSVLLDTFVIRTTLSPAIMYLCGRCNYEPCLAPPKYNDPKEFHPEAEDDTEAFDDEDEESGVGVSDSNPDGASEKTPLIGSDATKSIQTQ